MGSRLDDEHAYWTTRIRIRPAVKDAVQTIAKRESHSTAAMLGILLQESVTARSTA